MSTFSEIMKQHFEMQRNAQEALPVVPNNGNPNGVYNNPQAPAQPPINKPTPGRIYPWLAPSPSMDLIQQMLAQPLIQPSPPRMGFDDGANMGRVPLTDVPTPVTSGLSPVLPVAGMQPPGKTLGSPRMDFGDGAVLPQRRAELLQQARGDLPALPMQRGPLKVY